MDLLLNCLNYDFIGCSSEDPTEDNATIQVPPVWRPIFESQSNMSYIWEAYTMLLAHRCKILVILVQIVSVRRSVFQTDETRTAFLHRMLSNSGATMRTALGMDDPENFHHMSRLCAKIVSVFNRQDLMLADNFTDWAASLVEFTIKGFRNWEVSPFCFFFLFSSTCY